MRSDVDVETGSEPQTVAGGSAGWQYLLDLYGCRAKNIDDVGWVREIMLRAAAHAGAHVLGEQFHRFLPQGISGVVVIGESHLAVHTWPELRYAAVDLFTCSSQLRVDAAASWLAEVFGASETNVVSIERGLHRPELASPRFISLTPEVPEITPAGDDGPRDDIYIAWDESDGGHWFTHQRTVISRRTRHQHAEIIDFAHFGRALVLDGSIQSTELDEYIYHEALVHPAMCLHHHPQRVLILGGGEGATAREVLKHGTVSRTVMVDLDGDLVALTTEHLDKWHHGALADPRLRLVTCDGYDFIRSCDEVFDVIVVDLVDSFQGGPAESLYSETFFAVLKRRLAGDGILAIQAMECDARKWEDHARLRGYVRPQFRTTRSYGAFVPSFCSTWGFVFASDGIDPHMPSACLIDSVIAQRNLSPKLRFYDGRTHQGLFSLSKDMRNILHEH